MNQETKRPTSTKVVFLGSESQKPDGLLLLDLGPAGNGKSEVVHRFLERAEYEHTASELIQSVSKLVERVNEFTADQAKYMTATKVREAIALLSDIDVFLDKLCRITKNEDPRKKPSGPTGNIQIDTMMDLRLTLVDLFRKRVFSMYGKPRARANAIISSLEEPYKSELSV